jgi:hypothetical protein
MNRSVRRANEAMDKGMCRTCYIRPAMEGIKACEQCRETYIKRLKKRTKEYKENNQCPRCGAPLEEDEGTMCFNCNHKDTKYRNGGIFNATCRN